MHVCIKSGVITLESIEMYGFVNIWMSVYDGPYWVILLMYGSRVERHSFCGIDSMATCIPRVDRLSTDPRVSRRHKNTLCMRSMNVAGAFVNPKGITINLKCPYRVLNVVLGMSASLTLN